jgi:hypothetical protein
MLFIVQFTKCFGPYKPSAGDPEEYTTGEGLQKPQYGIPSKLQQVILKSTQLVTDYINYSMEFHPNINR